MAKFLTVGSATGAKAEDAEFFSSDLAPRSSATPVAYRYIVTIVSLNDLIEVTVDSGTTWVTLGTPTAATLTTYSFNVRTGDTVNFRTPNVGGTTLTLFRVDSEIL